MKKLAVTFTPLTDERLQRIKHVATGYEIIPMKIDDERAAACEIIFGQVHPKLLPQATHLKWIHTQSAGVDSLLKPENNFPKDVILTNSAGTYGIAISEYLLTTTG